MRLTFCVACGEKNPDLLHHHHLLPRAEGGTEDETNLITLCLTCHGRVHGQIWRPSTELARRRAMASRAQRLLNGGTGKLVLPPRRNKGTRKELRIRQDKAEGYKAFVELVDAIQANGTLSFRRLAEELNANGLRTARGEPWQGTTVFRKLRAIEGFFAKNPALAGWLAERQKALA